MSRIIILLVIHSVFGNIFSTEKFFPSDLVEIFSKVETQSTARIENNPNNNDPVRKFLTHYNSLRPIGVLVDENPESLETATDFMKEIFRIAPGATQITYFLSTFNSKGTTNLTEINGNNPDKIYDFLKYKPKENSLLGVGKNTGTSAFYTILNAANTLPQDGALLIFIDGKINDEDLAAHTGIVRKKNIKVYVIWSGQYPTKTNEERLLKELTSYSGGLFLVNGIKDLSTYNYRKFINRKNTDNTSVILTKKKLTLDDNFIFPIDAETTCIHILLSPAETKGALTSPTGKYIDVNNNDSITSYGTGSFGITERGHREIYLQNVDVGAWRFDVRATTSNVPCNVTVFACTTLTTQAYFSKENEENNSNKKKILKVDLNGSGTISNITFVDNKGHPINNIKRDFLITNNEIKKQVGVEIEQTPDEFQVLVQGTDVKGNLFSRLSYVNSRNYYNSVFPQQALSIEVGLGSELIITGGKKSVITFEITNLRNVAADVNFICQDEKSILWSMYPQRSLINPQETVTVTLTLSSRFGIYQDLITFQAIAGSDIIQTKVIVDVGTQTINGDTTPPSLDYTYLSECSKVIFSSCEQGTWTIEARAKDTESGLLQVTSYPKGLYFQNGFTTGTKEEVSGTYSDSCCNSEFQLIAIDRAKNRRTITTNAYRASWGPGQIAALVLGILLLILLIVLIVYLVRRCMKKRENYDLPTYRGRI